MIDTTKLLLKKQLEEEIKSIEYNLNTFDNTIDKEIILKNTLAYLKTSLIELLAEIEDKDI